MHPQNWSIARSLEGLMMFANTAGLLEYDGVSWRQHALFENLTITSLTFDSNGRLFIGGRGEFGFVQPDSTGSLAYHSLTGHLPDSTELKVVWETSATSHGVYFRTNDMLLRWDGSRLQTWQSEHPFGALSVVRDTVYTLQRGIGLMRLDGDSLRLMPDGEQFANTSMYVILPFTDEAGLLLGSRDDGLFVHDGRSVRRFRTPATEFLQKNRLYHGTVLQHSPGRWALATTRGGLIILDADGAVRLHLDQRHGLLHNKVHFLFEDPGGHLWISLNNGLAMAELNSPFSLFDARTGIKGTPHALVRHQGTMFAGTDLGLFRQNEQPQGGEPAGEPFVAVPGLSEQVWALHTSGETLLIGAAGGIFSLRNGALRQVADLPVATYCFLQPAGENIIYAGNRQGLSILEKKQGRWQLTGQVAGISSGIRTLAMDAGGALWLGTVFNGVLRLTVDRSNPLQPLVEKFGEEHGLPRGLAFVYAIDGEVKIGTYHGIYRFDGRSRFEGRKRLFAPDSTLPVFLNDPAVTINRLAQAEDGTIWAMAGTGDSRLYQGMPQPGGGYRWRHALYQRLAGIKSVTDIYPEAGGHVWLAGRDETVYHIAAQVRLPEADFAVHIRRVSTIPGDSLIFGGAAIPQAPAATSALPFERNSLRFSYAAASYDLPGTTRYQVKLEGYDDAFSPWTLETRKDYTRLPAGEYTFTVRARDLYDRDSRSGQFAFAILAPWYQSWWAYLLYLFAGGALLTLVTRVRLRYLEQKNRELEALIAERTQVVREQAEKLRELDTMKSRFFANISHEFRTPLTLVFGALDDLLERAGSATDREQLGLIRRQSRRVLKLINQLLDLSRLETGAVKLRVTRGQFDDFLRGIVMSFASLAEQKKIELRYESDAGLAGVAAFFAPDQVEKIFYNLLSNAFKFTPEGGTISVRAEWDSRTGIVEVTVQDTGTGIAAEQLGSIFQRFFTAESQGRAAHEGTGIGLALTRELVELHKGEISVRSSEGRGSEFSVRLPITEKQFSAEEIVPAAEAGESWSVSHEDVLPTADAQAQEAPSAAEEDDRPLILIVEDHPEVRAYISNHLQKNYRIAGAADGEAGEKLAVELIPDLIISDVMMPKQDGYALCAALKQNEKTSHIPIILLTARAGEGDKLAGLETGADDYLTKPFNSKELNMRVRNLITLRRTLQERFRKDGQLAPREVAATSVESAFINKMMTIIEEQLGEEEFGVESLSRALHMSRRQVHRKIKAISGETPTDLIRRVRLQRARQLLEQKAGTVSEIAFQVGFGSLSYFSTAFKKQFGILPSEV